MINPVDRTIMQNAWVVDDVEAACLSWVKDIGIGPFFIADVITLGVFLAFPEVITWLPDLMIQR